MSKAAQTCQHPSGFGSELGKILSSFMDAIGALQHYCRRMRRGRNYTRADYNLK